MSFGNWSENFNMGDLVHGRMLIAHIWRRGRGIQKWHFKYVHASRESWFTTPGWYHHARRYVYRLTVDHDYPQRPLWLGRRQGRTWVNMEGLYEPLLVVHREFIIATRNFYGTKRKRSPNRINRSAYYLQGKAGRTIEGAKNGNRGYFIS